MSKKDKIKEENIDTEKCCHNQECHCSDDSCDCEKESCCCEDENCNCTNNDTDTNELLSQRIKTLEDALLRSQAELLNYRKRKDEETARILKYAEEDILKGFLPILDNFERAIAMDDNNFGDQISKFLEGFRMVYTQTKNLLEAFDVKEIECIGKEFDPTYAQAIQTEKDDSQPSGTVLKVYQKGYMYKDRILRTAMVIVNE